MPVERLMPTEESADLIALTRDIVDRELRPRVDQAETHRDLPPRRLPHPRTRRAAGAAVPRGRTAAAGSRTRSTCRSLEEIASAWACGRRRDQRPRPLVLRAVHRGHRRAEAGVAAGHARRRPARRVLPVRGARRLRPCGDAHPRRARRRRVRHQRREGVDHPRRRGRLLQGHGPHLRRRRARHLVLPRAGRHARTRRRQPRGQDGPDGLDHGHDAVRRRPRARRAPPRRRGPGAADRARRTRLRTPRHRRRRDRRSRRARSTSP